MIRRAGRRTPQLITVVAALTALAPHPAEGQATIPAGSDTPLSLKPYHIGGLSRMLGVLKMHDAIQVHLNVTFGADPALPNGAKCSTLPATR
jgi:hypothetical protein